MEILKAKSNENFKAGLLLLEQGFYDSSIHSFYYSCLQYVLFSFGVDMNNIYYNHQSSEKKEGYHNFIINNMYKKIYKVNTNFAREFQRDMSQLKKLRVTADYKNIKIDNQTSSKAQKLSRYILKILGGLHD